MITTHSVSACSQPRRVRDSSCTLWWLVVVMENDDTQRDGVLGIFDNNATCSLCKPQLLISLVLVEPCVIASCSHLHLQHDEPTPTPSRSFWTVRSCTWGGDWNRRHVGPALLCWARDAPWCRCCLPCPVSWKTIPPQPSELLSTNGRSVNWGPLANAPQRSGNGVSGCPAIVVRSPST